MGFVDRNAGNEAGALRAAIRRGEWTTHTSGLAPDRVQGNLVILPADAATDFLRYCQRNPRPCPLLAVGEPGDPGLPQLEHTLQRFPKLIMFGHGPVFWSEIARLETPGERGYVFRPDGGQVGRLPTGPVKEEGVVPKLFRRYPNLYGDLSDFTAHNALARDPEYGPKFLTEFQDRLFFGTDICFFTMPIPLVDLLLDWRQTGKIGETVFQKVARENAVRFFELG